MKSTKKAKPSWWPSAKKIGLLDVRRSMCTINLLGAEPGSVACYQWPAVARFLGQGGTPCQWGSEAWAWRFRSRSSEVVQVFPAGWPADCALARAYLRKFYDSLLSGQGHYKVYILMRVERDWVRRRWLEVLEDSRFSLQGELSDWQHDLLLECSNRPEKAFARFIHIEWTKEDFGWQILSGGERLARGRDSRFSLDRLRARIIAYARAFLCLELGQQSLDDLFAFSASSEALLSDELAVTVAGRHVHSGLPARAVFLWKNFLSDNPLLGKAWLTIKSEIFAQIVKIAGAVATEAEGLDFPGWRIITADPYSPILVEGLIVRALEYRL